MKKVLFIISTLNTGGAQRIISNMIMAMPKDWDIDILLNDTDNITYPYRGNIIDMHMKPEKNKETKIYQIKALFHRYRTLRRLKKENNYAACISALDSANFVNVLTGKKHCKCILTIHGYHVKGWAGKSFEGIANWLVKKTYCHSDQVVAVSEGLADEMLEKFKLPKNKVSVIYNGYNVEEIRNAAEEEPEKKIPFQGDKRIIVTSGRMETIKGQWHLLKAFSIVEKECDDARLVLLGDGQLRGRLEMLAETLGIKEKVFLAGFVKNPYPYYKAASLLTITSLSEGFSNVIVEAMICDIPCISSDCVGPCEILKGKKLQTDQAYFEAEYGILTPGFENDCGPDTKSISPQEQTLAKAMIDILKNENMYQKYKNASGKRYRDFDMSVLIQSWIDLMEK